MVELSSRAEFSVKSSMRKGRFAEEMSSFPALRPHERLRRILFGNHCLLCRGRADDRALTGICTGCESDLPRIGGACCPRCALPGPAGQVCGQCLGRSPAYDETRAALRYAFPADKLIQAFKFRAELVLSDSLARLLLPVLPTPIDVEAVIAVPLAAGRLRERGYNQAAELARALARHANLTFRLDLVERIRETPPQIDLPREERRRNVRGAFRSPAIQVPERVAVVDDVMTSGATLHEVASALKRQGAKYVCNWILARTVSDGEAFP
jgi:ComF family protein